jgi:isoquinoline 1-oxidoreductase subunit alpha
MAIVLVVNGKSHTVEVAPNQSLLSVLRNNLDLTGTKYGCGEGQCGACTVLLDGKPVRSCLTGVGSVAGKKITTIEGLEQNSALHPVQEGFLHEEAFQCGYCTPGMIMTAVALLQETPRPDDQAITQRMNGNVCRCGTYPRIVAAVRMASRRG